MFLLLATNQWVNGLLLEPFCWGLILKTLCASLNLFLMLDTGPRNSCRSFRRWGQWESCRGCRPRHGPSTGHFLKRGRGRSHVSFSFTALEERLAGIFSLKEWKIVCLTGRVAKFSRCVGTLPESGLLSVSWDPTLWQYFRLVLYYTFTLIDVTWKLQKQKTNFWKQILKNVYIKRKGLFISQTPICYFLDLGDANQHVSEPRWVCGWGRRWRESVVLWVRLAFPSNPGGWGRGTSHSFVELR